MTTEKIEATFWHWIGLRPISFYYRFQWLGRIAGALLWLAAMTYLVAGLWVGIELFGALVRDGAANQEETVRNIGLVFVALIGAPFVAWRAIIASAQAKTAYEGLLTDRFTKAVEQLGAVRRTPRRERLDKEQWGQWETPRSQFLKFGLADCMRWNASAQIVSATTSQSWKQSAPTFGPIRSRTTISS